MPRWLALAACAAGLGLPPTLCSGRTLLIAFLSGDSIFILLPPADFPLIVDFYKKLLSKVDEKTGKKVLPSWCAERLLPARLSIPRGVANAL